VNIRDALSVSRHKRLLLPIYTRVHADNKSLHRPLLHLY
jgi:hypothetical protein